MSSQSSDAYQQSLSKQMKEYQSSQRLIALSYQALNEKDALLTVADAAIADLTPNQLAAHLAAHDANASDLLNELSTLSVEALPACCELDVLGLKDANLQALLSRLNEQAKNDQHKACDVVLFGFGRIGRILTRLLMARPASKHGLQLKAIVVRPGKDNDLAKRASLLERDSVHGWYEGQVAIDETNQGLIVNGRLIQVIYAKDPAQIDYTQYGINNALLIDNTGVFKDEAGLGNHLKANGIAKVLLTAPAQGNIKNVVYGVNHSDCNDDALVSAASCTTNAITPTLKILNDQYGISQGHVETIHAFTNDQNLIDNHHKADRRGRAAPLNMVITSTGAAKAVGKALPELQGKLSGNAIRVPTPNVSMAILNLQLNQAPESVAALNDFLRNAALSPKWRQQIGYSDSTEAVSTDFLGCEQVGIVDGVATLVNNTHVTIYIWYDNEVGYSTQVIRLAEHLCGSARAK